MNLMLPPAFSVRPNASAWVSPPRRRTKSTPRRLSLIRVPRKPCRTAPSSSNRTASFARLVQRLHLQPPPVGGGHVPFEAADDLRDRDTDRLAAHRIVVRAILHVREAAPCMAGFAVGLRCGSTRSVSTPARACQAVLHSGSAQAVLHSGSAQRFCTSSSHSRRVAGYRGMLSGWRSRFTCFWSDWISSRWGWSVAASSLRRC